LVIGSIAGQNTKVMLRLAIQPTVSSPIGDFLTLQGIVPNDVWAPSADTTPDGRVELYFGDYEPDSILLYNRANLARLVASDPTTFTFDGLALLHGDSVNVMDGRGIENAVVFSSADGTGWRMLYAGGNQVSGWQLYGATSTDRRTWVKTGVVVGNGFPGVIRPVGEGMAVHQMQDGTWRMVMAGYEPAPSTVNAFEITQWTSQDQVTWQYVRTLFSSTTMPLPGRCAVYSPHIRQIGPSMWRMVFAAHSMCGTQPSAAIYSAVSSNFTQWQFEGQLLGAPGTLLFYAAPARDFIYFVRRDSGGQNHLAGARVIMP
jgi:hypothetical protein